MFESFEISDITIFTLVYCQIVLSMIKIHVLNPDFYALSGFHDL